MAYSSYFILFIDATIYGKNIKEQITNEFLKQIEKEKEYIFSEKKDLHERLKKIAKQI